MHGDHRQGAKSLKVFTECVSMSFNGFEELRQQAFKVCSEAIVIVVFIIMLLVILAFFFVWLEWRGKTNKPLYITELKHLVEAIQ